MVLGGKPTLTRFPTNSLYTPVDKHTLAFYIKCVPPVGRPLQSPFVGKITNASYQPCSYSLNSLQLANIREVWRTDWRITFGVWSD